jgi:hypothetical protein
MGSTGLSIFRGFARYLQLSIRPRRSGRRAAASPLPPPDCLLAFLEQLS